MTTLNTDRQTGTVVQSDSADASPARRQSPPPMLLSRLLIACLFWLFCLTLTAAGHRLYKATVSVDRQVSAQRYRTDGAPLVWVGYGTVEAAAERVSQDAGALNTTELVVLPNSSFWLGAAMGFTALAGLLAWSGRWVANNGIQSLLGLFAGHFLWLGAIEFGLDAAGRQLGLAGSVDVVEGRVVGTHGAGTLIQLSVVFLVPMLIGLTLHESNRCAVFQWFRRRLPITLTAAASGRVENYAARTAMQYFMTVWFCYVGVLWMADPRLGRYGEWSLLLTLLAIVAATPYMIWRTARQPNSAQALRYSVSGAVVAWTAIEIAAAMRFFHEPWLSNSISSGAILLGLSIVLTVLAARTLFPTRGLLGNSRLAATAGLALLVGTVGCARSDQNSSLAAAEVEQRLREYDARIQGFPPEASDGLMHALSSNDPVMRAQAAIAFGKSPQVSTVVEDRLQSMAKNDDSRLSQFAALTALQRLDLLIPELRSLLREFGDDSEWRAVAEYVGE